MSFKNRFTLIAGTCVVENKEISFEVASRLQEVCNRLNIDFVYKGSFVKANRTKVDSFRGIGKKTALEILAMVREKYNLPVVTDIHETSDIQLVCEYVDILQIPSFLSRQTYLLEAAAETGKPINIKKGEFMTAETLKYQVEKIMNINPLAKVFLTERGMTFGKNDLVIDYREIPKLKQEPYPCIAIVDCSHTVQRVNLGGISEGNYKDTALLARAAIAAGADGVFIETHPNPSLGLSDASSMMPLAEMPILLEQLSRLWDIINANPDN